MDRRLDAQQAALAAAGAERVFAEKVSGAVTDRRALARAASRRPGGASAASSLIYLGSTRPGHQRGVHA